MRGGIILYRKKKGLWWLMLVFFMLISAGAVYAVITNSLSLSGEVRLENACKLVFDYPTNNIYVIPNESDSGKDSLTFNPDGQSVTVDVTLKGAGDSVTLYYNIVNTGPSNAKIVNFSTNTTDTENNHFMFHGTHNLISGQVLAPNATIENCELTVTWIDSVENDGGDTFSFTVNIGYQYTTEPATVLP